MMIRSTKTSYRKPELKYSVQIHRTLTFLVLLLLTVTCQTTSHLSVHPIDHKELLLMYQPFFLDCTPSDGTASFSAKWQEGQFKDLDMVWNASTPSQWDYQWNTIAGNTVFDLNRRGAGIQSSTPSSIMFGLTPQGFLVVNKYELPIKDVETFCFAAGVLPQNWLRSLYLNKTQSHGSTQVLEGDFDNRSVQIQLKQKNKAYITIDASIEWGGFLGLWRHRLKLIMSRDGTRNDVTIDGPRHTTAKWWTIHEST